MKYQNVFVLSPGRSGSATFIEATKHLTNYSAAHESRTGMLGLERFNYPTNHIEADNRLTWFLGSLGERFDGDEVLYVDLRRSETKVIDSFVDRFRNSQYRSSIIKAFAYGIVTKSGEWDLAQERELAELYVKTVAANTREFLKDRKHLVVNLEDGGGSFAEFLVEISAEGDREKVMAAWGAVHNAR